MCSTYPLRLYRLDNNNNDNGFSFHTTKSNISSVVGVVVVMYVYGKKKQEAQFNSNMTTRCSSLVQALVYHLLKDQGHLTQDPNFLQARAILVPNVCHGYVYAYLCQNVSLYVNFGIIRRMSQFDNETSERCHNYKITLCCMQLFYIVVTVVFKCATCYL